MFFSFICIHLQAVDTLLEHGANPSLSLSNGVGSALCAASSFMAERRRTPTERIKLVSITCINAGYCVAVWCTWKCFLNSGKSRSTESFRVPPSEAYKMYILRGVQFPLFLCEDVGIHLSEWLLVQKLASVSNNSIENHLFEA